MTDPDGGWAGPALVAEDIACGPDDQPVVRHGHLQLGRSALSALSAPSGTGTSLLLGALAGTEAITEGRILIGGRALDRAGRREQCALLEQDHHLTPELTAAETISLPLRAARLPGRLIDERTRHWLDRLALTAAAGQEVTRLSGGQRQRVALARCLAIGAPITILDEPTAELDPANRQRVIDLLRAHAEHQPRAVLVATHDDDLLAHCVQKLTITDQRIVVAGPLGTPDVRSGGTAGPPGADRV